VGWKGWDRVEVAIDDPSRSGMQRTVTAIAPLIVSASRSTDIPAFYGDWFLSRLKAGYAIWQSPFGGAPVTVSFERARVFAFWSKNPQPFLSCIGNIEQLGYGFFFLYTLNDYVDDGLEPGIPPLDERIRTFQTISERIGPGRVIWRFDPLLVSDTLNVDDLLDRIQCVGNRIHRHTQRLAISFIDIAKYAKVRRNLAASGIRGIRELTDPEITELAGGLASLNERWHLSMTACGERHSLAEYGIHPGQCIGYDMLRTEFSGDSVLMEFLDTPGQQRAPDRDKRAVHPPSKYLKDPGQRGACGCIVSKDIGQYSTCPHGCVYCYANASRALAKRNYERYCGDAKKGVFHESIIE
jgi:hypothetical protein